ncbi:MAG: hypothetical protein A2889_01990 [Nitrospinae bacterium RIFCSPLOWO2_01_FULL_39_10]|nr:MAG: hypothetical protein A2889_01990 [Nitrospinae bacterium RIFCSPLOWO2_01_FULL_39_10]
MLLRNLGAKGMGYEDIKNIYEGGTPLTINELIEILYGESIHICPDEMEASSLAISALTDFLKSYPFLVCHTHR